ncbi:S1C family serine protease [Thermovenabulum gondwanense]|uniref:Putative serine protease HtrA n=1 Tax=Thermovenabulum gondwanense TaxID=520767 RepID=A0A162MIL2_9FIRM|nr:trypsin-like peptidase domain-containing protein [Thermovenabulum gondwanense]KYO66152.1 putative serine protease HtrA [Thermovenabulum gondwanense]
MAIILISALIGAVSSTFVTTKIIYGERQKSFEPPARTQTFSDKDMPIPDIAREITPAVVGVVTTYIDYDFFFRKVESQSIGSGILVDERGYILTNAHVVTGSNSITVYLYDGRKFKANKIYEDGELDLAVIKIDGDNLTAAKLGDSDKVVVGDRAVAIGNPLGLTLQRTVTAGIISALNRTIAVGTKRSMTLIQDLIQTDASINPGNSGGPLLNGKGEVIGINTVKATEAEAIGFAIPINLAKPIIKKIQETGRFEKPYIGIEGIDREMARLFNIEVPVDGGIFVIKVHENSPAQEAGIRPGDIVLSINGEKLTKVSHLRKMLYALGPGQTAEVELLRGKQKMSVSILIGREPQ